jgi:geranylgeranyl diphosphate synthase type I
VKEASDLIVDIESEIRQRAHKVREHIFASRGFRSLPDGHLRDAVLSYPESEGKAIRAALAMLSCGAVGGDEAAAIPIAAAVEIFHSFSLVHDDIIDNDALRRGRPTVHREFEEIGMGEFGVDREAAEHYGVSVGILAGDSQHGWAVSLLCQAAADGTISPELAVGLIDDLEASVLNTLVSGELLDVQFSMRPIAHVSQEQILTMLDRKTGALYEFCCRAGAMAGLGRYQPDGDEVAALVRFARAFGTAFQIKDDVLGIVGAEEELGKPVGSDLREGKRTLILSHAYARADPEQKRFLSESVGDKGMSADTVEKIRRLVVSLGSIAEAESQVQRYAARAVAELAPLPDSRAKRLLRELAQASANRRR